MQIRIVSGTTVFALLALLLIVSPGRAQDAEGAQSPVQAAEEPLPDTAGDASGSSMATSSQALEPETADVVADEHSPDEALSEAPRPAIAEQPIYRLEVRRTPKALEISGSVPDQYARQAIVASASTAVPDLPMTISLLEEPGAPPNYIAVAVRAIGLLSLLAEGGVQLSDQQVDYTGIAYHAGARSALAAAAEQGWPSGYTVSAGAVSAGPPGPPIAATECEKALGAVTGANPIEFEAGRADIRGDSSSLMDRIAYVSARCPDALISVAGHTDSDGTDESNYQLSLKRARTVVDLLVADGIPEARFTALGYGESRPLASNGTLAGKARNRRIEFVFRD